MIIFSTPLMFTGRDVTFDVRRYIFFSVVPLTLVIVFYLNYFHLIETYFLNDKKKQFVIINTILIIALGFAVHYWMNYCIDLFKPEDLHTQERLRAPDLYWGHGYSRLKTLST